MGQQEKEDALHMWLGMMLGSAVPIIWEAERGPRPNCSYLKLSIPSDTPMGTVEKSLADSNGVITLTGHNDISLSIQSFGANSVDYLIAIKQSIDLETNMAMLNDSGFVIRNIGPITPVPEIIDETPEKRWIMELQLGYAWSATDTTGYIENVEITKQ